jgi:putative membrane protein
MKHLVCAACCVALFSFSALAQTKPASKGAMAAKGSMTDQQFVDMAGQTDMIEAHLGQLAQENAASDQVKQYGQMLVTDHTADYQQLKALGQQANLTVPNAIDDQHYKEMIAPLAKLKGAAFDKKFEQEMVAGHTKAVDVYKKESDSAESPMVKSYASTAEPVLEKHLSDAKSLTSAKPAASGMK